MFTALLKIFPLATVSSRENSKNSSVFVGFIVHFTATINTLYNNVKENYIAVEKAAVHSIFIIHLPTTVSKTINSTAVFFV